MKQNKTAGKIATLALAGVILGTIGGELTRLPFGPGLGTLPGDLILAVSTVLLFGMLGWKFFKIKSPATQPLLLFIAIAFLSWLNGTRSLTQAESLESFLYYARFTLYAMLFFMAAHASHKNAIEKLMIGAGVMLALLGFLQLYFFPSFLALEMEKYGWDPHENRLLSTWFDPNFIGGLFAFLIGLCCDKIVSDKTQKKQIWTLCALGIMGIALFMTYSRSAYLALIVTVGLFSLIHSRKIFIGLCIAAIIFTSISTRAQERIGGLIQSVRSLTQEQSGELPDATARLRIQSWENSWTIFTEHPVLGVGFNAFKFAQLNKGYLDATDVHSGSGSDASLLTVLATTGIAGFSVFCWLFSALLIEAWKTKKYGLLGALCGLLVHSLFVNSLLLPFMMVYLWIGVRLEAKNPLD